MSLTRTLPAQRPTWLESPDAHGAVLLEDPKVTNAELVFVLMLDEQDSKDEALEKIRTLEAKLAECSTSTAGLPLVWEPYGASTRTATIACLSGEITDLPIGLDGDGWWWFRDRPVITVRLVTEPFGDLAAVTGPTGTSTSGEPVEITFTDVPGTAPAKPYPITVTNDHASLDARTLLWGATLDIEAPLVIAAGTAGAGTLLTSGFSGAAGTISGELVKTTTVYSSAQAVCGTGEQEHQGTYRVLGRVYAAEESTECRIAWQANDGPWTFNAWKSPPVTDAFGKVDLGLVTLTDSGVGTQTWRGRIEATGGSTFAVERLQLVPVDIGYGVARAPFATLTGTLGGFEDFTGTTAAGTLNGRVAPVGGTWATSGAATDFTFIDANGVDPGDLRSLQNPSEAIIRTSSATSPRYAILGSSITAQIIETRFGHNLYGQAHGECGVVARWTDSSNYLRFTISPDASNEYFPATLKLVKVVAGVATVLATGTRNLLAVTPLRLVLTVLTDGSIDGTLYDATTGGGLRRITASDTALATGGTLATGKQGIYDTGISFATSRWYDDFSVTIPPAQTVVISHGQDFQLTHESVLRADSAGVRYGRPRYSGRYLLIPPAGDPDRSTRFVVMAHSNDLDVDAWSPVGLPISVESTYIPRVKVVP